MWHIVKEGREIRAVEGIVPRRQDRVLEVVRTHREAIEALDYWERRQEAARDLRIVVVLVSLLFATLWLPAY